MIVPLYNNVLVKPTGNSPTNYASVLRPLSAKSALKEAIVVSVGENVTELKPGDRVCFGGASGVETKDGLLMSVHEVYFVYGDEKNPFKKVVC